MSASPSGPRRWKYRLWGVAVLTLLFLSLGIGCLARSLNHDEAQFLASGALLARERMLPYLDYPYFHLPNLVFVYAALFSTNDFLLLTARSFNLACAWLLLLLVYVITASAFRFLGEKRWVVASAATLLLALNPLFRFTVGRAWNHDLPVLASVAALAAFLQSAQSDRPRRWIVAAGFLLEIAAGTRLTFMPLVVPFLLLLFMRDRAKPGGLRSVIIFLAAYSVALLPAIALFAAAPSTFFFDNVSYNGPINLRFRQSTAPAEIAFSYKLLFPIRLLVRSPGNLLLVLFFAVFGCWLPWRHGWRNYLRDRTSLSILVLVPFILLGAVIPSPSYRQYYYAIAPFLLLGAIFGVAHFWNTPAQEKKIFGLLFSLIAISSLEFAWEFREPGLFARPDLWPVFRLHEQGLKIRRLAGSGPVLTLAPISPLEGGCRIYKEFCTGSFAWRAAPFVEEADQKRFAMIGGKNFEDFLVEKPPAILTGYESRLLEKPLIDYAERNAYAKVRLSKRGILWLRP